MKKSNLNKVFTSLLVCMLAVTVLAFQGCSDGDERVYPTEEQKKPQVITNAIGTLLYENKQWVIHPEGMSIESSIIMIIKFKNYSTKKKKAYAKIGRRLKI